MHRCAWATDIHLNFLRPPELTTFTRSLADSGAECVLLTGDISEAPMLQDHLLHLADTLLRPIYFVLGNHDSYRSSIANTRLLAQELSLADPHLHWLPHRGVIRLGEHTALVGCDGIADARHGDWEHSSVMLNDFVLIEEFARLPLRSVVAKLRQLADLEAAALDKLLAQALDLAEDVIVLTHVPPFREASWHDGALSNDEYLPWFTCKAVGDVLMRRAESLPRRRFTVLCGHTHGEGEYWPLPNLEVRTGGAAYGAPRVQSLLNVR